MFRLTQRLVSMGLLVTPGLLLSISPALSVAPPPRPEGKLAPGTRGDSDAPTSTTVTIDRAGVATFALSYKEGGTRTRCFRAADFDDAVRTLGVSSDPEASPATGGPAAKDATATPPAAKTIALWTKDKGVFMIPLSATTTIKFSDPATTNQVQQALDDLALGGAQPFRSLVVKLPAAKSGVTYRHSLAGFDAQYRLTLGPTSAAISARVTVRNSTAQAWTKAEIRLAGLPWPGPPAGRPVSLKPDDSATFTVRPAVDPMLKVKPDSLTLTYTSQQTSPNPDLEFTLTSSAASLLSIPGPVAVGEGDRPIGQVDGLDVGGGVETVVKVSAYPLMSVRQLEKASASPAEVKFVDGLLEYRETRKTTLIVTNAASVAKTLTVEAADGWSLGPKDEPASTATIPAGSSATVTVEEFATRRVALVQTPGFAAFLAALPKTGAEGELAKKTKALRADAAAKLDDLDRTRQALASAIQAIAARQPAIAGAVPVVLLPQLAQDEATVAGLRQQMDAIPVAKAALQSDLEAAIRQEVESTYAVPGKASSVLPPPKPLEEDPKESR